MKAHTTLIRVANNAKGAKNIQTVPTRRRLRTRKSKISHHTLITERRKDNLSESVSLVRPKVRPFAAIDVPKCQKEGGSCDSSIIRD